MMMMMMMMMTMMMVMMMVNQQSPELWQNAKMLEDVVIPLLLLTNIYI